MIKERINKTPNNSPWRLKAFNFILLQTKNARASNTKKITTVGIIIATIIPTEIDSPPDTKKQKPSNVLICLNHGKT